MQLRQSLILFRDGLEPKEAVTKDQLDFHGHAEYAQTSGDTFTGDVRIASPGRRAEIQSEVPGFWLDETPSKKGLYVVLDNSTVQFQRRAANFGAYEARALRFWLDPATNPSLYVHDKQVWDAGNDGPGSGMDSDTVDGSHASDFAASLHGDEAHSKATVENAGATPSIQSGTRLDQPAAGTAGRLYYVTDEDVIERDDGTAWSQVADLSHRQDTANPHGVTAAQAGAAPSSHVGSGGTAHADVVAGGADGFITGADKSKLDGVESGATADQSAVDVPITDAGANFAATEVEAALAEEADARQSHEGDTANPHSVTAAQAGAAPSSHVGAAGTAEHPAATSSSAGFLSADGKAKLDALSARISRSPTFTDYDLTLASATWTRLSPSADVYEPHIDIPILGAPPTGFKWYIQVSGTIRVTPDVGTDVYIGGGVGTSWALDGSTMIAGMARTNAGHQFIPLGALFEIADPTMANVVTFSIQVVPGATVTVRNSPRPTGVIFLGVA